MALLMPLCPALATEGTQGLPGLSSPECRWGVAQALKPGTGSRKEARAGSLLLDERLTFMILELMEERDGTSTVNGPDVVRISRQPWSGGARKECIRMDLGRP